MNCGEALRRIEAVRSEVEDPSSLHAGVQHVEYGTHRDDPQRHRALSLDEKRVDERAVQVMELEQGQKDETRDVGAPFGTEPQHGHGHEHGRLHQHPSFPVVDLRAPFSVPEHAVSRPDEVKGDEHDGGGGQHDAQKQIEFFVHKSNRSDGSPEPSVGETEKRKQDTDFCRNNPLFGRYFPPCRSHGKHAGACLGGRGPRFRPLRRAGSCAGRGSGPRGRVCFFVLRSGCSSVRCTDGSFSAEGKKHPFFWVVRK